MTEDEAKTKWCPFVRFEGEVGTFNRGGKDPLNRPDVNDTAIPRCIASACMAWRSRPQWRWNDIEPPEWHDGVEPQDPTKGARLVGYCGLAGAPR